jgi:hypothetical protein
MSKSYEAIPSNDGPEILTVEKARKDLIQKVADFILADTADGGFTFHEMTQDLLMDPNRLRIYVDIYNKVARKDWEQQREADRNMVDQWLTEGGADFPD